MALLTLASGAFAIAPPSPPVLPNGYDVCIRDPTSRDAHNNPRCNVLIGTAPCESITYASDYTGLSCLYIGKPFFHAFICAKCITQVHGVEANIDQCLTTQDTDRFSILRTGRGFSISVLPGKGHDHYNTVCSPSPPHALLP